MTQSFANAISPEASQKLDAFIAPETNHAPEPATSQPEDVTDQTGHELQTLSDSEQPSAATGESLLSGDVEGRPDTANLILENFQAVVTSADGRHDTPAAAVHLLEKQTDTLFSADSISGLAQSLQAEIVNLSKNLATVDPGLQDDSLRTTIYAQHNVNGVNVTLFGQGSSQEGATIYILGEDNALHPIAVPQAAPETKQAEQSPQQAQPEKTAARTFGAASVLSGMRKALQWTKQKTQQGKAKVQSAHGRATESVSALKERLVQKQPSERARNLGATALLVAGISAAGASHNLRRAGTWVKSAATRAKGEVYMAPQTVMQMISNLNERRLDPKYTDRHKFIARAALVATGALAGYLLVSSAKHGSDVLASFNFGNKGQSAANDALASNFPTTTPKPSINAGHDIFSTTPGRNSDVGSMLTPPKAPQSDMNAQDFLSPSKGDGLKEQAAEQLTQTSSPLESGETIWSKAHDMLESAGYSHDDVNVDAVTKALQAKMNITDYQATQMPIGTHIPWISDAQLHEILSEYDNTTKAKVK